jgi:hypothetical protein
MIILMAIGIARQTGLDKENFTGAITYNWNQKKNTARFDLFNVQFVRNLNPNNTLMYTDRPIMH